MINKPYIGGSSAELERIIDGCKAEDPQAQKQLYRLFYAYGLSVCLHYANNREEAEEMVHNGFIRVFEHIDQYRAAGEFKAWFRTIIVRSAINYYHRVQKNKRRLASAAPQLLQKNAYNRALKKLAETDAYQLLQGLTPAYRMVISLHVLEGYTHREIAQLLNISVGTSKSNLAKAKAKLAVLMKKYYPHAYESFKD